MKRSCLSSIIILVVLAACSSSPVPPRERWEGRSDGRIRVYVRVEINEDEDTENPRIRETLSLNAEKRARLLCSLEPAPVSDAEQGEQSGAEGDTDSPDEKKETAVKSPAKEKVPEKPTVKLPIIFCTDDYWIITVVFIWNGRV